MGPDVGIIRCNDYSHVEEAVRKSVRPLRLNELIFQNSKVLLKINLLVPALPDDAVTTHPEVVRAVIHIVKECDGVPIVGDMPGLGGQYFVNQAFEKSGIRSVCEEEGVEISNFQISGFEKINLTHRSIKELYIAKPAIDADIIISLPKLKTHTLTLFTGAIKNMFGVIPPGIRRNIHLISNPMDFAEAVVDIYEAVMPELIIMDGVVGMEGNGPQHGTPRKVGYIISSKDGVALDIVCSKLIGFDPYDVPTNVVALKRFNININDINLIGDDLVPIDFKKPSTIISDKIINKIPRFFLPIVPLLIWTRPKIDEKECKRCMACVDSCPTNSISFNPNPAINYKTCIECFCCHELCPNNAVKIDKSFILKVLQTEHATI